MKKIIIDADPGTDDFIAITMALKSNKFDVLGITTVEGNCSLDNATKNAFKTLNLCGRDDIEVYKGLENNYLHTDNALNVFGNNGFGGIEYTPINRVENEINAVDYIIKTVNEYPDEITIVAIGPLTNIAACIQKDPNFVKNVKELIIMGGSALHGNVTSYAEFNFYKDPKSANKVVTSDFKSIKIIGLDVANMVPLTPYYANILNSQDKEIPKFIYNSTRSVEKVDYDKHGGAIISDPLTIAYLIDDDIVKLNDAIVSVVTEGEKAGQTLVNFVQESNCKFAVSVKTDKFYSLLIDVVCK